MEQHISMYKIFNSVAKTGNISHAAKELYISQPAISKTLARLEDSLGVTLFHRTSRGVHLTDEGALLYQYTKSAFDTLSLGEESIRRINELGIGHLRIGVSTTLCKYILLPYLKSFIQSYPHIKITIECQSTFHTIDLLEQGKLDIGLIGKPNKMNKLEFYTVTQIEDIFVATESYLKNLNVREPSLIQSERKEYEGIASINGIDLFQAANIMLLDENNMTRLYINDYFTKNKIEINQILQVSNMDLLIEFAKIGLGVSCVIKEFIIEELTNKTLVEVPLPNPLGKRDIGFAHSNSPLSDSTKKFIDFFAI